MEEEQLLTGDEQENDLQGGDNEERQEETAGSVGVEQRKRPMWSALVRILFDQVFPRLSSDQGKLSRKRSVAILLALYSSHVFSAWGDRMWLFGASLFLALLYPGSLLMPGVYGLVSGMVVVVLGTIAGDWVDLNRRMKVAWVTLLSQNTLLAVGAVVLTLMFFYQWNVCDGSVVIFAGLSAVVIIVTSLSNLATVANTISIEKDWVVVIAGKDENTLAALNATMRRIDLMCKVIAPIVVGALLEHAGGVVSSFGGDTPADQAGGFVTALVIAIWNIVSFFGELGLLWVVYRMVPALAIKRRRSSTVPEVDSTEGEVNPPAVRTRPSHVAMEMGCSRCVKKLLSPYYTLVNGWSVYVRQEVALAGVGLACLYLTVLGFSGVTSTFLLTQGLTADYIGLAMGIGGVVGISGTLAYPFIRRRLGTAITGVVGLTTQLSMLTFCVVGVFIPSREAGDSGGYYSPNCSASDNETLFPAGSGEETWPTPSDTGVGVSVMLVLVGVCGARFGLWIFDLSLWQLVQERVVEEERGVVSGVINSMIANMDMLHYVLVIAAPRPQDFRYLTAISFVMVSTGLVMYVLFMRKARGGGSSCRICHGRQMWQRLRKQSNLQLGVVNSSSGPKSEDAEL